MAERVCALDDLKPLDPARFDIGQHRICMVRIDDDVYALGDTCSHQNISLSEGEVDADERTIECWKHGSTFSLETGEALILPATRPVPVYEVRVDGGDIVVVVDD